MAQRVYAGTLKRLPLYDLTRKNVDGTATPVTALTGAESIVWQILDSAGAVEDSGTITENDGDDWAVEVTMPATPGAYRVRWALMDGAVLREEWYAAIRVVDPTP